MADPDKNVVPPYVSYKSFTNFIKGLKDNGCPSHITRSVMPGSNSGKATMAASLRYLGLVTEDEEPTLVLQQLIGAESDYRGTLNKILRDSYEFLNDGSLDLEHTTTDKVAERFRDMGAGGSTVAKCMAFFLAAAKDAGIEVSPYVKALGVPRSGGTKKSKANSKPSGISDGEPPYRHTHPPKQTWQEQLLAKFPEFDPSWNDETREKWFDAFQELMKKGGND